MIKNACQLFLYMILSNSVIYFLYIPCFRLSRRPLDHKEVQYMNKYELALVVSAKIDDDARTAAVEKAKAIIEKAGGTITNVDDWGKKRLAYEIQKMKEAYYYFIHFESDAETPSEIEQRIRIMDNVIRYLCVRQEA